MRSPLQAAVITMACMSFVAAGIYIFWLVYESIGTGGFPAPYSKLPGKYKINYGLAAVAVRLLALFSAMGLFVMAFMWGMTFIWPTLGL